MTVAVPRGAFNVIKFAMEQTRPGDVLVVNAWGLTSFAVWGGNVSKGMQRRRIASVVVDGAARGERARGLRRCRGAPRRYRRGGRKRRGRRTPRGGGMGAAAGGGPEAKHAKIQPVLERGEVTNIAAISEGLREQGFAVDGRGGPG